MNKQLNELEKISFDLGLNPTNPEWGIENADADRVAEFIRYYFQHEIKKSYYEYLNLVCDSMNDALLENKVDEETHELFEKFVFDISPKEQQHSSGVGLAYWLNIKEENQEFPVVKLLRSFR